VVVLIAAGCGGGGDDSSESTAVSTATTTALTKAELIEQGDAICAEVNAAVGTVGASSSETGTPAAEAASLYSGMVDSLRNLGAPQEAEGYPEFSAAADELGKSEDEVKLAAEREDTAALETAESSASSALASFQTAASTYGFKQCSEGPSAPTATAPESGEARGLGTPEEEVAEGGAPEAEPEAEAEPEVAPETGGAGGAVEGGGTGGGTEGEGGTSGGESGGIGPG
jgi:hypothetical protein